MSWSYYVTGTREAVAKKITGFGDNNQKQGAAAKELILSQLAQPANFPNCNGVKVEASGHSDANGVASMTIKIENFPFEMLEPEDAADSGESDG